MERKKFLSLLFAIPALPYLAKAFGGENPKEIPEATIKLTERKITPKFLELQAKHKEQKFYTIQLPNECTITLPQNKEDSDYTWSFVVCQPDGTWEERTHTS